MVHTYFWDILIKILSQAKVRNIESKLSKYFLFVEDVGNLPFSLEGQKIEQMITYSLRKTQQMAKKYKTYFLIFFVETDFRTY
jgi:hypothetical protein